MPGEPAPALVEGLLGVAVAAVCCGGQHAAVLTAAGEVYTWGRGGFGRLGHGDAHSLKAPRLVRGALVGVVCAQVACGFAYTAAVSAQGALYTWGAGENGRLGLGDVDDRAGKESDMPNFKGSDLGRFPLVSADFWTSDHLSERSRRVDAFPGTRARGTLTLKRT